MHSSTHEVACLRWRSLETLHVSQQSTGTELQFEPADSGDGIAIKSAGSNDSVALLSWAFSQHEPSQLQLAQTHISGDRSSCKRTVAFSSTLYPRAVYHPVKGVIALTADGSLHSLLPSDHSHNPSLLDGLKICSTDVRRYIDRLEEPSTLATIDVTGTSKDDLVCIGGQSGSILVAPAGCFDAETTAKPYELHHNPSGYRAFFSKTAASAVTWIGSLQPFAPGLLCALHADCSLRFWSVTKRQRVLVEHLLQQSGQRNLVQPTAVGAVCNQQGHFRLVVHLEPKAGSQCQPQTIAVSMDLQLLQEGSLQAVNMRERLLEHDNLQLKTVLTHSHASDTHSAQTWLLSTQPSLHAITSSVSGQPHEESCRAVLIEKQGVDVGQKPQPLQVRLSAASRTTTPRMQLATCTFCYATLMGIRVYF